MRALELKKVVTAGPKEYDIAENGTAIGEVDIDGKSSGDHATIKLADKVYRATLDGGQLRCTLSVEADGERVATAEKAGALKASFNVKVGGKAYVFTKSGLFGRKIALTEGGKEVGSMKGSVLNLPDDLPVDGQALIIWIFVVMEKWDSDNNAGL